MAGCVSCFILPLILFLFHRFIQPIILKYFNPWAKTRIEQDPHNSETYNEENKQNDANNKFVESDSRRLKEE